MSRSLAAVAEEVRGRLVGNDAAFEAVTTDTRSLAHGSLFVAIHGERFDGHDFVGDAHAKGAAGALVSRVAESSLPQVEVENTRRAFGEMASAWRDNFSVPVIAVTGSSGKTTVKELIAGILGVKREVCVTEGNLNNDIGVPLTLMRMRPEHEALVVELGANHAGEIDYLSGLVEPTVGVITNAGAAHLEGFGSLAEIAEAKGELLDHLPRAGTSVINADDPFRVDWQTRARTEFVITFGLSDNADCRVLGEVKTDELGSRFTMRLPDGEQLDIALPLLGQHNVVNALAAAAAAYAVGARATEIRSGLAQSSALSGRLTVLPGIGGAKIIDDSYNANPASAKAALDYLSRLDGRRILVLGDMAELGDAAADLHREVGSYARERCDDLFAIGSLACETAKAFGSANRCLNDIDAARAAIEPLLDSDVTLLVKGSRVMGLERLVEALAVAESERSAPC